MTPLSDALAHCSPDIRGQRTRMLVRVNNAEEASQADAAGADAVEFALMPTHVADRGTARKVRSAFSRRLRLRSNDAVLTRELAETAQQLRADEIALTLTPGSSHVTAIDATRPPGVKLVGCLSTASDAPGAITRFATRVDAVMLEAGQTARLVDCVGISELHAFASLCKRCGLPFGVSGKLEAPDVARLLLLAPDVLGFDTAVRIGFEPEGKLDPVALQTIRALIPRAAHAGAQPMEAQPVVEARSAIIDRIFVRDFVLPLSIGAYQKELGRRQRVRFSVEADILREAGAPRDMRDVFSYDIILETIRVLAQRAHVTFVETLAEDIAAALLAHSALVAVTIRVEKLDVIDGAVGIEINRRRQG